jgi:hypothetical protein
MKAILADASPKIALFIFIFLEFGEQVHRAHLNM